MTIFNSAGILKWTSMASFLVLDNFWSSILGPHHEATFLSELKAQLREKRQLQLSFFLDVSSAFSSKLSEINIRC